MKKSLLLIMIGLLLFGLCACSHVTVPEDSSAQLRFHYMNEAVDVRLSEDEAVQLCNIVNGKELYVDHPSCGFSKDVSVQIGGRVFCPACDSCCIIKDVSSGKFFSISQDEQDLVVKIFEAHGGFFPCV